MGNGLVLKFKGNKSFVAFSNLGDAEALTKTWKVCTKVAAHLEQGQRLENLSWRLWHLQNLMVESDDAKSKREFRKLSKHMGEKLDKEKGRSIEELSAPRFHRNQSTEKVKRLAEEKKRNRETHSHATGHGLNRMQFTFSVDTLSAAKPEPTHKNSPLARRSDTNDTFSSKRSDKGDPKSKTKYRDGCSVDSDVAMDISPSNDSLNSFGSGTTAVADSDTFGDALASPNDTLQPGTLRFPTLFSDDFAPTALLYPTPDFVPSLSYGEGVGSRNSFGVTRPTIEVPLDELLGRSSSPEDGWLFGGSRNLADTTIKEEDAVTFDSTANDSSAAFGSDSVIATPEIDRAKTPKQQTVQSQHASAKPSSAPLSVSTKNLPITRTRRSSSAAKAASATAPVAQPPFTRSSTTLSSNNTNAPTSAGGSNGRSECVNCGATHTPLWRRGLNDELNCNACGLYCKLHKRPRPKTMRQQNAESGRPSGSQKADPTESMGEPGTKQRKTLKRTPHENRGAARCVNCHTMATPLWRKDDEGKTVCNACGLYFKLHNANRPISMKSDIIRKRSRHEQRRSSTGVSSASSVSPGPSRESSPERSYTPPPTAAPSEASSNSAQATAATSATAGPPTHVPDPFDPTQAPFNFPADEFDYPGNNSPQSSQADLGGFNMSEMMGITSQVSSQLGSWPTSHYSAYTDFENIFPGPFHPDYLRSLGVNIGDGNVLEHAAPQHDGDSSDSATHAEHSSSVDRGNKRRRLSTESYQSSISATEPPSSASSMFPHDNSSSASFSSMGFSTQSAKLSHHRNDSAQHSDVSAIQTDEEEDHDYPMSFLHPPMVTPMGHADHEREIMEALLHPPLVTDNPANNFHPSVLPFSDYSNPTSPVNNNSSNDFMDITMGMALFNGRY